MKPGAGVLPPEPWAVRRYFGLRRGGVVELSEEDLRWNEELWLRLLGLANGVGDG